MTLFRTLLLAACCGSAALVPSLSAAKAAPDGYTLGLGNATSLSAAQFMTDKMPFDSDRDLALLIPVVAPAGTPPEVQKRLHAAAVAALQDPQIAQQFLTQGALPAPESPEDFRATHRDEKAKWLPIVKANNIRLD